MMRAFAPFAVTASEATTTSGLGSGLGSGSQYKNSRSYLKLILCFFLPNSCPHTRKEVRSGLNHKVSFQVSIWEKNVKNR